MIQELTQAERVVSEFSTFVNNFSYNENEFINAISKEHRTLQQSMFRVMWKTIQYWASLESNQYDLRNEGAVLACKKIVKLFPQYKEPYLPHI